MRYLQLNDCLGLLEIDRKYYATAPPYSPNVVNQTVAYGGGIWKGNPGSSWTLEREEASAVGSPSLPGKHDINPATGKAYAVNPDTGHFDDNYWANVAEPALKAQQGGGVDPGAGFGSNTAFNLPDLYKQLFESSGISAIEADLSNKTKDYTEAKGKINDNPFLSEATRVGRIAKIESLFHERTANIKNDIATKKADIEMQLNLQTKQFDIESQAARDALDKFNVLLQLGAYDNASGVDIANITRATGLSSNMIKSAIDFNIKKNTPKVETQVISFDDGDEQGFAVVNSQTGEIISKQTVAKSTPTAAEVKAELGGGGGSSTTKAQQTDQNRANLKQSIKNKVTLKALVQAFSSVLSIDEIYREYNLLSPWGRAKETLAEVKQGKFKV